MQQIDIPLDRLSVSALNVRKDLQAGEEDGGINELAASIRENGLLSPPVVRLLPDGRYEVLAGQRRLLACRRVGLDPVPCLVREGVDDNDAVALSLVENVHRANMHPLDKARSLKRLYERHGSYERVARETSLSTTTVRKYVLLLELPEELQGRVGTADGPAGVGTLARLATTFHGSDAVEVFRQISGFTQRVQDEILRRSDGDLGAIEDLVLEAQEGVFDLRRCGGRQGCEVIRDILQGQITQTDFQKMIRDAAANSLGENTLPAKPLQEAARAFWKVLASK